MNTLGEPLVHRIVESKETLIYNHEQGEYFFLFGVYEGNELILRLENQIVVEAKVEKTGSGRGFLLRPHPTTLVQEEVQDNQTV